jgi:hypothetical protein
MCLEWPNELCLQITRKLATTDNRRQELERRCLDEGRIERHGVKIVV